jgi:hypothetical protein
MAMAWHTPLDEGRSPSASELGVAEILIVGEQADRTSMIQTAVKALTERITSGSRC